ncbi:hypothetical protein [Haliangium sp.]|uniref:hypothetical protein n=1 Tax=Haliangium sp. TaxID=2663208 RepID=UPI003D12710F
MQRIISALLCAAFAFTAAACSKDAEPEASPPPPTAAKAGDEAAPAAIEDKDLPVETDFEEAASTEITADNYKDELEALATEIEAEQ